MKYAGMPMGMWVLFAGSFQKQLTAYDLSLVVVVLQIFILYLITVYTIKPKGALPGSSSVTELPFLLHKPQCEAGDVCRAAGRKTFTVLPDATLSGAKTTHPAGSQGRSGWTG